MGVLREGIRPFPEVVLWFVSVDTEMNEKIYKRVFCMFAPHKTFFVPLYAQTKNPMNTHRISFNFIILYFDLAFSNSVVDIRVDLLNGIDHRVDRLVVIESIYNISYVFTHIYFLIPFLAEKLGHTVNKVS